LTSQRAPKLLEQFIIHCLPSTIQANLSRTHSSL